MNFLSRILQNIDYYLAFLGIISSSILCLRSIYISNIISFIFAFLIFLPCLFWLSIRNNAKINLFSYIRPSYKNFRILLILFLFLLNISILSLYFRENHYDRPLSFFILIAIMAGILVAEIIYSKETQKYLILIQIIILGLLLGWSRQLLCMLSSPSARFWQSL